MDKTNTYLTAETITAAQIAAIREEALLAGDTEQVTLCDLAAGTRGAVHPATWRRGWHLAGVGPARWGWAAYSASGRCQWLGCTLRQASRGACARAINEALDRAATIRPMGWSPDMSTPSRIPGA